MSTPYLAQREDQQPLEWIGGSVFSVLLDAEATGGQHELREGGIAFPPRRIPHGYRITSEKADLLLISTPGGLEKMFRHAGRDLREPRPEGFEIPAQLLAEAAELSGNVILGPPR
jgi:hypothetical protein